MQPFELFTNAFAIWFILNFTQSVQGVSAGPLELSYPKIQNILEYALVPAFLLNNNTLETKQAMHDFFKLNSCYDSWGNLSVLRYKLFLVIFDFNENGYC